MIGIASHELERTYENQNSQVDIPKDHKGPFQVVMGLQVNGESNNGAIDNKEPNNYT